jgi:MFS superfamily sulfate permease-like transporter
MRAHNDLALMALTFFLTIAYNIEVGVLVSFVISLLVVVRRSSKVRISILVSLSHRSIASIQKERVHLPTCSCAQGRIPGTNKWSPISEDPEAEELPSWTGVLVIAIRESLDFGMFHRRGCFQHLAE